MARPIGRRRAVLGALGVGVAAVAAAVRARAGVGAPAVQGCRAAGEACSAWLLCCPGLTCLPTNFNPNSGICTGTNAGTSARTTAVAGTVAPTATATAAPTQTPTPSPTPAPVQRRRIDVSARCNRGIDQILVENRDNVPLTIETIRIGGIDYGVNRTIAGGRTGRFEFGNGAGRDRVRRRELIGDDDRPKVVTLLTSDGTFRVACRDEQGGG